MFWEAEVKGARTWTPEKERAYQKARLEEEFQKARRWWAGRGVYFDTTRRGGRRNGQRFDAENEKKEG